MRCSSCRWRGSNAGSETFDFAAKERRSRDGRVFEFKSLLLAANASCPDAFFETNKKPESCDSGFVIVAILFVLGFGGSGFFPLLFATGVAQRLWNRVFLLLQRTA